MIAACLRDIAIRSNWRDLALGELLRSPSYCWRRSETDPFAGLKLTHPGLLI